MPLINGTVDLVAICSTHHAYRPATNLGGSAPHPIPLLQYGLPPLGPRACKCHLTKEGIGKYRLPHCHSHVHTCIHIIGPSTGLAAASCWGAACPRIEHIINWALHLTVIDGLGALGGAEGEEGSQWAKDPGSHRVLRPRYCMLVSASIWSRVSPGLLCLGLKRDH